MTAGAPALECERLTKRYGRVTALRAVDITVAPGECVALFGRNGAGKTTLIHVAGSLIRSYNGEVRVFGESLRRATAATRRAVGIVLHDTCLYLDLTVADNLRFFARLYQVADVETRVRELLARVELDGRAQNTARDLSRGMKQRLAIARALIHRPRLLLLDEPFTGLDELSSQALATLLQEFAREGGAVLMSTHDLERAFHAATRAVILERGSVSYDRPSRDVDVAAFRHAYWNVLFTGTTRVGAPAGAPGAPRN
jgi:heme ABC exporter ATP-binding subunit CcmA